MRRQLHPRYTHAFFDSCGFDPGGAEELASRRILEKNPNVVPHSVQRELTNPNTPASVKAAANSQTHTNPTQDPPDLLERKEQIRLLVQGNAKPGKHERDAEHLYELYKYGGGYFITTDARLLSLSSQLFDQFSITTIKPSDYERLLDSDT